MIEENAILSNGTEQSYIKKNYEYDPVGNQLKSVITSSTTPEVVERTYDELGRVKTKSVSNIEGKTIYVYDFITSDGLTAETSIDQKNNITTKVYDAVGRLAFVKNGDINAANIAEYDYYKNGSAKSVIYAGGAREDYTYYPDGRLESLVNKDNKGVAFESYVYTYDVNGNMLSKEDKKGRTSYTYDNLNRLKTVDEEYIGKTTEYIYDKLGNRSNVTIKENGIITEEHTYNYNYDLNQLNSVIMKVDGTVASITYYTYDGNGNQIKTETDGITTIFAYDEFNQLISADGVKYGYNAEGYRISKNVDGSLTRYLYEYDKVVLEVNTARNQIGRNIYGTNLLMRTVDGESYCYMYNGHADVTALINVATGSLDATYYYYAFGNIIESTGAAKDKNSILYSGYQYDSETGFYYLNARMYDPKIARFLQEDTYTGNPNDPLSLNLYTYVKNNPLIYYDPTGHISVYINGVTAYINPASGEDREFVKYLYNETSNTAIQRDVTYYYDNFITEKAAIEAYDLLNMYISTASSYSRFQMDAMYRNMFMDIQIPGVQNQYVRELEAIQELLLENRAIQSNDELLCSIAFYYMNYELFSREYANKLIKELRTNNRFDKVINDEISRRNIENLKEISDFTLDSIDLVGDLKGGFETIFGYNLVKQKRLTKKERIITGITTAAPFVFGAVAKRVKTLFKSAKSVDNISAKVASKLAKCSNSNVSENIGGLFRRKSNIGEFKDLQIPMQMREVKKALKASDISYDGIKIKIVRDPELIGKNLFGYTYPNGKMVALYPDAFTDMESLVKTLGHERIHVYQNKTLGIALDTDIAIAYEKAAYEMEDTFWNYFLTKGDK